MFKIKLIEAKSSKDLEKEVNNFIHNRVVLEVDVKEVVGGYLASIIYKDIQGITKEPVNDLTGKVKVIPLSDKKTNTPFDILSRGGTLADEGN